MKKRAAGGGFAFPYPFDESQEIYPQYGATKTPHVFLLEKVASDYIVRYIGAIRSSLSKLLRQLKHIMWKDAVEALAAGEEASRDHLRKRLDAP
ncbi:MAG: hypothetical protein U5L09_00500 [Bacteroidales bacterium]|nr:hypothetical protein [Bacteroidales bacterium]